MPDDQTRVVTDYYIILVLWFFVCITVCICLWERVKVLEKVIIGWGGQVRKPGWGCVCVRMCLSLLHTLYPSITPFFCVRGTADHVSRILVEVMASAVTFTGDPDGTREYAHKPLSALPIFDLISLIFPFCHLSPSINPSLKWRESVEEQREVAGWNETQGSNRGT